VFVKGRSVGFAPCYNYGLAFARNDGKRRGNLRPCGLSKEITMNKKPVEPCVPMPNDPDLLARCDFTQRVHERHAGRSSEGYTFRVEKAGTAEETRLVRLFPDAAAAFSTDAAVHAALREWLQSRRDAA